MKFLVLALFVSAASAASFGSASFGTPFGTASVGIPSFQQTYQQPNNQGYNSYNPVQQAAKVYGQAAVTPVVAPVPLVTAAPVYAAEAVFNGAQSVAAAPAVAAEAAYTSGQLIAAAPVAAAKATYNAAQVVATAPIAAAQAVVDSSRYQGKESAAPIVSSETELTPDGFKYRYATGNGISAQATGSSRIINGETVLVVEGSYQYNAPDGTPVVFQYVADQNGYQPRSNLIPVAPPIPEIILRSLEWAKTHPYTVDADKN